MLKVKNKSHNISDMNQLHIYIVFKIQINWI